LPPQVTTVENQKGITLLRTVNFYIHNQQNFGGTVTLPQQEVETGKTFIAAAGTTYRLECPFQKDDRAEWWIVVPALPDVTDQVVDALSAAQPLDLEDIATDVYIQSECRTLNEAREATQLAIDNLTMDNRVELYDNIDGHYQLV
jgi:hypothetical protein